MSIQSKLWFFPVVMYGSENWTIKKAKHWRIDAFELWCWRRLLRVSWTARRSNQSILKEISPECSLEGLMLQLKLQWPPDAKNWLIGRPWCWKRLKAGGEGGDRGWDGWMASPTQWTCVWVNSRSWWWTGKPGMLQYMGLQSRTQLSDWTEFGQQSWLSHLLALRPDADSDLFFNLLSYKWRALHIWSVRSILALK